MNLFDTHSHYNDTKFDKDRDEVIKQTLESGVQNFIVAGCNLKMSEDAVKIAKTNSRIYSTVGISPLDINELNCENEVDEMLLKLKEFAYANKDEGRIVAIGEIGLDYYYTKDKKDLQHYAFIKQIELANEMNLPIVIHTREAVNDTLSILKNNIVNNRGVFHCCPLNQELIKEATKNGYYISFSGIITFKNVKNLEAIIKLVPDERILIETDSPYLSPEPLRGTRNNCMNVQYVAQKIAQIKGISQNEIADLTYNNAKKIFKIEDED